jgi:hypothetical protein
MKGTTERISAYSGLVFAVLLLCSGFLPGSPAKWYAPAADIQSYLQGKHKEILASMILSGIAYIFLLWFLATFAGMFRDAGQGRAATVIYGAGAATVAIGAIAGGVQLGLAKVTYTADSSTVAAMYGVGTWLYARIFWTMAAVALATWVAARRSKAVPTWYTLLTLLVGCVWIVSGVSMNDTGFFSITGTMGMAGFVLIPVWVGISSMVMLIQERTAHAPARATPAMG